MRVVISYSITIFLIRLCFSWLDVVRIVAFDTRIRTFVVKSVLKVIIATWEYMFHDFPATSAAFCIGEVQQHINCSLCDFF